MRKKFLIFSLLLAFILVSAFTNLSFATTHTLEEVADKFNNCSTVQQYKEYNYLWSAKAEGDTLKIELDSDGNKNTFEYTLNGSILSTILEENFMLYTTNILVDCVGQLNGYEDGELFDTLNSDEIIEYTVENEGYGVKELSEGRYEIKIDIDKKIPLVDVSKMYLKTTDFENIKNLVIHGQGGGESGAKIKMYYRLFVDSNGSAEITIGEKNETTESTYKSILSAIEVLFNDTKAVEYFKENYKSMSEGNKEFAGFTVDVDLASDELSAPEGTKISKVTVDRTAALETIGNIWTTELSIVIAKSEYMMNEAIEEYTQDSLARLRDTIIDGKMFLNNEKADEEEAKKLVNAINEAIEALEIRVPLESAVENAEDMMNNRTENYTQDSLARLRDAIIDGKIFLNNETDNKEREEELVDAINEAIESLEIEYTLEGAEQTFKLEAGKHLTFKFDIDFEDFETYGEVWIDEKRIEADNYTAKSGSTIITFNDEFTKTLAEGGHHLEIPLAQGRLGIAKTDFFIDKADVVSTGATKTTGLDNPRTGDNVLVFAVISVFAIAGLGISYYATKK